VDIGDFRVPKVKAIQSYISQNPPFKGDPDIVFEDLTCHEYFILAEPKEIVKVPVGIFN
jgi:hypothetical protein